MLGLPHGIASTLRRTAWEGRPTRPARAAALHVPNLKEEHRPNVRNWLTSWSTFELILVAVGAAILLVAILVLWLLFGRGPRRRRGMRQVDRLLKAGDWTAAVEKIEQVRAIGPLVEPILGRVNSTHAGALNVGAAERLAAKDYETALNYGLQASRVANSSPLEARSLVQNAMLEEARRLFSATTWSETGPICEILGRALRVQSPCREASFWLALCALRDGDYASAMRFLQTSRTGMDPPPTEEELADAKVAPAPPTPIIVLASVDGFCGLSSLILDRSSGRRSPDAASMIQARTVEILRRGEDCSPARACMCDGVRRSW